MSFNVINSIEREVQTSLEYISKEDSKKFHQELENLKEEKHLLEGKIRGYITLSDVCHEYKNELKKLQQEYDQLKKKINVKMTDKHQESQVHPTFSKPPTPSSDPGNGKWTDLDQRISATTHGTTTSFFTNKPETTRSHIDRTGMATPQLSTVSRGETPQNTNERVNIVATVAPGRSVIYRESIPMQESMVDVAQEHKLSLAGMGFDHQPLGSAERSTGGSQHDDLIVFGSLLSNKHEKESLIIEPQLESLTISTRDDPEEFQKQIHDLLNNAVKKRTQLIQDENKTLRNTVEVLTHENKELHDNLRDSRSKVQHLAMKHEELQGKLHDKTVSPQGWVHVQKVSEKTSDTPLKLDSKLQKTSEATDFESLVQQNMQLKDANQKWVAEWDKLQEHFETRTVDLRAEVDRLNRALTDAKVAELNKITSLEQMLTEAKQKAAQHEAAKEDLNVHLTSASQREDTLQARIHQLEELVTSLRRDKQTMEAELAVVKQNMTSSAPLLRSSLPEGQANRHQQELQTEVEVLRQQLLVFQEDFDRERQDRATAQSIKDDLKKKCDQLKRQLRNNEVKLAGAETQSIKDDPKKKCDQLKRQLKNNVKLAGAETQVKNAEDISRRSLADNEKLQQEITDLKRQLRREQEIREWPGFVNSGSRLSPPTRSPPFQLQQPAYRYQQPQQYIIPPQPQQFASPGHLMYMNVAGAPQPQVMRQGYYLGNQGNAGSQHENLPGAWPCSSCTYVNYPGRTVCEMCGYVQTMRQSPSQGNFGPLNETLRPRGDVAQPAGLQGTSSPTQNITVRQ